MLPLRDNIPSRSFPIVNVALIIVNILVYFHQVTLGRAGAIEFINTYGLVPNRLHQIGYYQHFGLVHGLAPFVTCMFLHGSFMHIAGNMLFLWIFGDNVEDKLGHFRYLLFYLVCGILAGVLHVVTHPLSPALVVGASGAIAGVLGAYIVMFPGSRVLTLIPILIILTTVEIPAFIFLGVWIVFQILTGMSEPLQGSGGVATWAHIGGFFVGLIYARKWLTRPATRNRREFTE